MALDKRFHCGEIVFFDNQLCIVILTGCGSQSSFHYDLSSITDDYHWFNVSEDLLLAVDLTPLEKLLYKILD